jgi:hypothetical protein
LYLDYDGTLAVFAPTPDDVLPDERVISLITHADIHMIGYVHEKISENVMVTKQENVVPIKAQGWNHFNG